MNSTTIRPRRSVLYMPGANTRALEKARELPVDGVIMDLEDAVAPDAKCAARRNVVDALAAGGYGRRELVVRVNGHDTPWFEDDLAATAGSPAHAVLLPKISAPDQVARAAATLRAHGAPDSLDLWIMAETAAGILAMDDIAVADPAIRVVVMGTADLAKELRLEADAARTGLLPALSHCVLAARAHGLDILDGVFVDLADPAAFRKSCEQGKALGFDGKTLVHPAQIDAANAVFGVSAEAVERAREIVAAWEAAAAEGRGIVVLNGRMLEQLHADAARRTLALAAAIEQG
ncbi:MAG: CoA ester lyase [Gammaproteobacteria bacterium]|nr:CoA ester lyase [Gammaproteobacteria bacterium]